MKKWSSRDLVATRNSKEKQVLSKKGTFYYIKFWYEYYSDNSILSGSTLDLLWDIYSSNQA